MNTSINVTLRNWSLDDCENLVRFANNKKIWDNLADAFPSPYTNQHANDFVEKYQSDDPRRVMAIVVDGLACGSIGLFPDSDIYRKNAAIAYWLAEDFWGKGICTEAVRIMTRYGFDHFDVRRIYARPFGTNIASHRVLEKAGYRREAILKESVYKNGKFLDEYLYSVLRDETQ